MKTNRKWALVALGPVAVSLAALLLSTVDARPAATGPVEPSEHALVADSGPCILSATDARAWAGDAERKARARWERAWFDTAEAPMALRDLTRAVACYRMLGDREARARTERDLTHWQRELAQSYVRARLELTLALRADDPARIIAESTRLSQLLSQAGSEADPYREHLRRLGQNAQAKRFERQSAQEEQ